MFSSRHQLPGARTIKVVTAVAAGVSLALWVKHFRNWVEYCKKREVYDRRRRQGKPYEPYQVKRNVRWLRGFKPW